MFGSSFDCLCLGRVLGVYVWVEFWVSTLGLNFGRVLVRVLGVHFWVKLWVKFWGGGRGRGRAVDLIWATKLFSKYWYNEGKGRGRGRGLGMRGEGEGARGMDLIGANPLDSYGNWPSIGPSPLDL